MKLSYLWRGLPGHPLHPPITDVVIGAWTFGLIAAFLDASGASDEVAAHGAGLAFRVGLFAGAAAAVTGLVDWLRLPWRSGPWWTGLYHLVVMSIATALFAVVAIGGEETFAEGDVTGGWLVLIVVAFAVLTLGGWLGGRLVYVHGYRVLAAGREEGAAPAGAPAHETPAATETPARRT